MTVSEPSSSMLAPKASPSPLIAVSPSQHMLAVPQNENHHPYHLTLIPGIGIAVTAVAVILLMVLIILIRRKSRELEDHHDYNITRGSYLKDIKKATIIDKICQVLWHYNK